jgi:hypothetical protein
MRRVIWLLIALFAGVALFYISRFWPFQWWGREGLFGLPALRPQGGLVQVWLRGTPFAPFELLIWAVGCFLFLTGLQKLHDATTPGDPDP